MRQRRPIKLGSSPLSGKIYAFRQYHEDPPGYIVVTGQKDDITAEFKREMNNFVQQWIRGGYLTVTETGAPFLNEFFGLDKTEEK